MAPPVVSCRPFGRTREGRDVTRFTLKGADGFSVGLLDYGAIIHTLSVPGRDGAVADVVLGYDTIEDYEDDTAYHGAVVGRVAGRIGGASFTLDGTRHALSANDGALHLHGGVRGFGKVRWRAMLTERAEGPAVVFEHRSPAGAEGYPGTLDARVTYSIPAPGVLAVDYSATTDAPTIASFTQHAYFNLAGEGAPSALEHVLQADADEYLPLRPDLLPVGVLAPVTDTPFDFRVPHRLDARIRDDDAQLRLAGGYDHSFAVRGASGSLVRAAVLTHPASGRALEVHTTEPAVHLYTGNFLGGGGPGKGGHHYARHAGVCLETQHFADAPHHPAFPSMVLRPGEVMRSRTELRFTVQR